MIPRSRGSPWPSAGGCQVEYRSDAAGGRRGSEVPMQLKVIEKLEDEIRAVESELHGELPRLIQRAREHGDLSENAEYAAAKERQRLL